MKMLKKSAKDMKEPKDIAGPKDLAEPKDIAEPNNITKRKVMGEWQDIEQPDKPPTPKKVRKPGLAYGGQWLLHLMQHAAITIAAVMVAYIILNSLLWIEVNNGPDGNNQRIYELYNEDPEVGYQDSQLFNDIIQENINEILEFVIIRGQMETGNTFDGSRVVDVTAFAERPRLNGNTQKYTAVNKYITAQYYLGNLLKWGQRGLRFTEKSFRMAEEATFLNKTDQYVSVNTTRYNSAGANRSIINEVRDGIYASSEITGELYNKEHGAANYSAPSIYSRYMTPEGEYIFSNIINENQTEDGGIVLSPAEEFKVKEIPKEGYTSTTKVTQDFPVMGEAAEGAATAEAEEINVVSVLENDYLTVENHGIEDYVSTWENYLALCRNVQYAVEQIGYNYTRYERYLERYNTQNSNVGYFISRTFGDQTETFSNLEQLDGAQTLMSWDEIAAAFADRYEYYLYYSPEELLYETNMSFDKDNFRNMVNNQQLYPDRTRIWLGVDADYQAIDTLYYGYQGYSAYMPNYFRFPLVAVLGLLSWLILLITLTMLTGRRVDQEGQQYIGLYKWDRFPTELTLALAGTIFSGLFWVLQESVYYATSEIYNHDLFLPALGLGVFIISLIFNGFYYSLVRRVRAGSLWRDSMLCTLCKAIRYGAIKTAALGRRTVDYANANVPLIIRVLVPLSGLVLVHIILLLLGEQIFYSSRIMVDIIIIALDVVFVAVTFVSAKARAAIVRGIKRISQGDFRHKVNEEKLYGGNRELAQAVNSIGDSISEAVEISMKDERMKADLITNVSHDIKTPLTSIINYVDLLKRENIAGEKVKEYVAILDSKSQRLKQLTDDLVEASKISSGNINLQWESINLTELVNQTIGEFSEKFAERKLEVNCRAAGPQLMIEADSRRIWRVMENLFNNIYKYAMAGTRVYVELETLDTGQVRLVIKNISRQPLAVNAEDLTERFIRGDVSRTTEGSGLGLSIAKSLTEVQNGKFEIIVDGDLFKVILIFPMLAQT